MWFYSVDFQPNKLKELRSKNRGFKVLLAVLSCKEDKVKQIDILIQVLINFFT